MLLDFQPEPIVFDPQRLNARFKRHSARDILLEVFLELKSGKIALTSSFGAEAAVLLHMVSTIDSNFPVLFLNTEMLFPQTLRYQRKLAAFLGLKNVHTIGPDPNDIARADFNVEFARNQPDTCCDLRKVRPLDRALAPFDVWITGRKRGHGSHRANMSIFETDRAGRLKINPLAGWGQTEVSDYFQRHSLPRHPLMLDGFQSIGCWPCTSRISPEQAPRAGRWNGSYKTECGIHFL